MRTAAGSASRSEETTGTIGCARAWPTEPSSSSPNIRCSFPRGERATFYVGTAIWTFIEVGEGVELLEMASDRPSDTWLGTPISGELCYAGTTSARRRLERLPLLAHRAVSEVEVVNTGSSSMELSRIGAPVPRLSVYGAPTGRLWTESLVLERNDSEETSTVKVATGLPQVAGENELLTSPRQPGERNFGARVFSNIFRT